MRRALAAALVAAVACWIYVPVLHGTWLWDDGLEVWENPALRSARGLGWIWLGQTGPDYWPLKSTVQWAAWHLWADRVLGYHALNLALHVLSACLLWRVLRRLGVRWAWLGGVLFAAHPLAVESVAWIAELKNALSLPFLLGSFLTWLDFTERGGRRAYAASLALFTAALLCKSSVAMLPLVLLAHAWWRNSPALKEAVLRTLPFLGVALAFGLLAIELQLHRAMAMDPPGPGTSLLHRLGVAGLASWFYAFKAVFPAGLCANYPRWSPDRLIIPGLVGGLLWLAIGASLAGQSRRRPWARTTLFVLACFLINLAPILGILPMSFQRISWVADHFAYVSLAVYCGGAAAAFGAVAASISSRGRDAPVAFSRLRPGPAASTLAVWAGATAVIVLLAVTARAHARLYRSQRDLWTATLRQNPQSWIGRNNLALEGLFDGHVPDAIAGFEAVLRMKADDFAAQANLGYSYALIDRPAEAVAHYQAALAQHPATAIVRNGLGVAYLKLGRDAEAAQEFTDAVRLRPADGEGHVNLGEALWRLQRPDAALAEFREAVRVDPGFARAQYNLGYALAAAGLKLDAAAHYTEALALRPGYPEALNGIGILLAESGRLSDSAEAFRRAIAAKANAAPASRATGSDGVVAAPAGDDGIPNGREPLLAMAHYNLAVSLGKLGRGEEAAQELNASLQVDPRYPPAVETAARLRSVQ